jgi:hypothetical protein
MLIMLENTIVLADEILSSILRENPMRGSISHISQRPFSIVTKQATAPMTGISKAC